MGDQRSWIELMRVQASHAAQWVKNPPAKQKTQVQSLDREDPLGGGYGNPLQYSCLENPMDRGARQAMVHRTAKSWTRLKQLSMGACIVSLPSTLTPSHAISIQASCLIVSRELSHCHSLGKASGYFP